MIEDKRTTSEYAVRKLHVLKKLEQSGKVSINCLKITPSDLKKIDEVKVNKKEKLYLQL